MVTNGATHIPRSRRGGPVNGTGLEMVETSYSIRRSQFAGRVRTQDTTRTTQGIPTGQDGSADAGAAIDLLDISIPIPIRTWIGMSIAIRIDPEVRTSPPGPAGHQFLPVADNMIAVLGI